VRHPLEFVSPRSVSWFEKFLHILLGVISLRAMLVASVYFLNFSSFVTDLSPLLDAVFSSGKTAGKALFVKKIRTY
jgi:hypothetical protein